MLFRCLVDLMSFEERTHALPNHCCGKRYMIKPYGKWISIEMKKCRDRFWEYTSFEEMTAEEWESLCDGCGKCCLIKIEDDETEEIFYTAVACRHLDLETCRCRHYGERVKVLPECVVLTPDKVGEFEWLPMTCAYRRLAEGKGLPKWHPLLTGNRESVHRAGMSVRNKAVSEKYVNLDDLEAYLLDVEM